MTNISLCNVRCMFCGRSGFNNLDQTSSHVYGLQANAKPSCSAISIEFLVSIDMNDKWFGADGQYYRDTGKYVSDQSVKNYLVMHVKKRKDHNE